MTEALTLRTIQDAVAGSTAAFPYRRRLPPVGSKGNNVPPLPFTGAAYTVEPQRPTLSLHHDDAKPLGESSMCEAMGTVFSPHVFAFQLNVKHGPFQRLSLLTTLTLTKRWREAILSHTDGLPEPFRRMLSGHGADGDPAEEPYLAFLPLALVPRQHVENHLLGKRRYS